MKSKIIQIAVIVLTVILVFIYFKLGETDFRKKIKQQNEYIKSLENGNSKLKLDIEKKKIEYIDINKSKKAILIELGEAKRQLSETPKIKYVEKLKTITIKEVEYIEKTDCIKLQDSFNKYLTLDFKSKQTVDKILSGDSDVINNQGKIIDTLKSQNKLLLKKINGWSLSYGAGLTAGSSGFGVSAFIGFSKRLKRL